MFTYDPTLSDNLSWVRLQIGDTRESEAVYSDEEILAVLAQKSRGQAAADLLEMRSVRGGLNGLQSLKVGDTMEVFGMPTEMSDLLKKRVRQLRLMDSRIVYGGG